MPQPIRSVALALFALGAFLTAASAEDPKELTGDAKKLVGKWKVGGMVAETLGDQAYMFMDFNKDGTGRVGVEYTDAELKKLLGGKDRATAFKWTVSGDKLELSEMRPADPASAPAKKGKDRDSSALKFEGGDTVVLTPLDEKDVKANTLTRMK